MFGYEDELLIKRDPSVQLDSVHLPIITSVKRISLQIVQTCSCSFIYEKRTGIVKWLEFWRNSARS